MQVLFMSQAVFQNLKSSFSADHMPVHALYISLKMTPKLFELSHYTKNEDQTLR